MKAIAKSNSVMRWLALTFILMIGPAWAQAPTGTTYMSGLSAGGALSSTDTLAACQVSSGCGSSQTLVSVTPTGISTYINAHLPTPIGIANGGTNATTASGTALDNITGFSSTGLLNRTGAGAYSFQPFGLTGISTVVETTAGGLLTNSLISALPFANLGTLGAYASGSVHVVANPTASIASPADTTLAAGSNITLTCATTTCTIASTASGGGITAPGTTVVNDVAAWNSITGAALLDTGILYTNLATAGATLTTNQLLLGGGGKAVSALGSLGSATTVLHGGTGAPSFSAVNLSSGGDTTGILPVVNGGIGTGTAGGTALDNITAFSSTGLLSRGGAGSYSFIPFGLTGNSTVIETSSGGTIANALISALPFANLAPLSANQVLGALTATTPSGLSVPSCSAANNALQWASGTGFGCTTISAGGSGTVNSGTGGQPAYYGATGTAVSGSSGLTLSATQVTAMAVGLGSDVTGDIYYRNSSGNLARLGVGANGTFLSVTTGLPAWVGVIPTTVLTGTLQAAQAPAFTGDVTSTAGTLGLTIATVNSNVGTFASGTFNGKGQVTAAGNLSGDVTTSGAVATVGKVNGVSYQATPSINTVPVITASNISTYEAVPYAALTSLAANQVLGALTTTTPSGLPVPSCSGTNQAINWTSGTGFGCVTISTGTGGALTVADTLSDSITSVTSLTFGSGFKVSPSSGTVSATANLAAPDSTKTTSYTLAATDMAGQVNFNGAALTATIPAIGSGIWNTGASAIINNLSVSSLTVTDTAAVNGCGTTLYSGGFYAYTSNGTSLDCFGFPGFGQLLAQNNTWSGVNIFSQIEGGVDATTCTTTACTIPVADCGKTLLVGNGSTAVTATTFASTSVPPVGTACVIGVIQGGTAKVTIAGGSSVSLISGHAYTGTSGSQGSVISLVLTTVGSTATAYLTGDGS